MADFARFLADKRRGSPNVLDREREALTNAIVAHGRRGDNDGADDTDAEDDLETMRSDALNQIDSAIADLEAARALIPEATVRLGGGRVVDLPHLRLRQQAARDARGR